MNTMKMILPIRIAAAALLLAGPAVMASETRRDQILTVSAQGLERIPATVAVIRLAVEERGANPEEARAAMARRTGPLLEFLRGQPVNQLETSTVRIQPIHDYSRNRAEIVGYQAVTAVTFRAAAELAGALIDQSLAEGANQLQDLRFTAGEESREEARRSALRQAARLARERAAAVMEELGLEEGRVVRVQIGADAEGPVYPMRQLEMMRATADASPSTEVEAGDEEVTARVSLDISYRSR